MIQTEVAIIGAGPGGVTAAIYFKRAGISFLLFEKEMVGGKVNLTADVDNYPPFEHISGFDLGSSYMKDLDHNRISVTYEEVLKVSKDQEVFVIQTAKDTYLARAVLIASGTSDKLLSVPGEKELLHKGISHCAVCDGNLFRGRPMAVVGGGNSALEECLYLASITEKVYLIHRRNEFRGNEQYVEMIKKHPHIEILTPYTVTECVGTERLESLKLSNAEDGSEKEIFVSALFEYVGLIPNASFVEADVKDEAGFIRVKGDLSTSVPGLFACGDVTDRPLRQIVVASGDGAMATHSILNYLRNTPSPFEGK